MTLYWITGTRKELHTIVTKILCGHNPEKMRAELKRCGFTFESQKKLKAPRFMGKDTKF